MHLSRESTTFSCRYPDLNLGMLAGAFVSAVEGIRAALGTLRAVDLGALGAAEILELASQCETIARENTVIRNDLALALSKCPVDDVGGSAIKVLADHIRISPGEARRRILTTEPLSSRTVVSQTLPPLQPETATAWRRGELDEAHVRVIQRFFKQLPNSVAENEKDSAEAFLADKATELRPDQLLNGNVNLIWPQ